MWMLIIACISADCSGAVGPLFIPVPSLEVCKDVGTTKAAVLHYWTHYDYEASCAPIETPPGGDGPPVLDYRDT